jgi:hypothetical protein
VAGGHPNYIPGTGAADKEHQHESRATRRWAEGATRRMPPSHGSVLNDEALPLIQDVRSPSWWVNSCDRCGIGLEAGQTHV